MAVHKYTSWGRTRSPKNIAGANGSKVTVLANTDNLEVNNTNYKTEGYSTQNQRYLHVLIEDANTNADPGTISIYGYNHAFQKWVEISQTQLDSGNTSGGATAIDKPPGANNGSSPAGDPAQQEPKERDYRVYEIVGIDRVAFASSEAVTRVNVWAATSTF